MRYNGFFRLLGTLVCVFIASCQITPPRVDPYTGLVAPNFKQQVTQLSATRAELKAQTVYVVVGANYIQYADAWAKFTDRGANALAKVVVGGDLLEFTALSWSPERTNGIVVEMLKKHFSEVKVVEDFSKARQSGANWIVMYDHAYVQTSTATATWSNTTTIDLLNRNLDKAIGVEVVENSSYGAAWGNDDVRKFGKARGEDILKTITKASRQFDEKVTSSTR